VQSRFEFKIFFQILVICLAFIILSGNSW